MPCLVSSPLEAKLSGTVYLHVGVAKTGTTYLQGVMHTNRDLLRGAGVCYPGRSAHAQFQASIDLRGTKFKGYDNVQARGMWDRLTKEVNTFAGRAVISQEALARTRKADRARAVSGFATQDVQVVITARDLGRQVPAVWQENVKNGNTQTYDAFLHAVLDSPPEHRVADAKRRRGKFWQAQDIVAVARRWSRQVGHDRLTIVTVPQGKVAPHELWRRFRAACALPDLEYELPTRSENQSVGAAESEVLRRMNERFPADLPWQQYEALVKRGFAATVLASQRRHGPLTLPETWRESTAAAARQQVEALAAAGYVVVGDLADLEPCFEPGFEAQVRRYPDDFTDDELFEVSLQLLGAAALHHRAGSEPAPDRHTEALGVARRLVRRIRGG